LKDNPDTANIFGAQANTWFTEPIDGQKYFSKSYQKMDRIDASSRYFRNNYGINNNSYNKGYIWNYDPVTGQYNPSTSTQNLNNPLPKHISVGSPFHFYFGLKKGKSAWDRFAKKWIGFNNIID
jgi:hypothetical protein